MVAHQLSFTSGFCTLRRATTEPAANRRARSLACLRIEAGEGFIGSYRLHPVWLRGEGLHLHCPVGQSGERTHSPLLTKSPHRGAMEQIAAPWRKANQTAHRAD